MRRLFLPPLTRWLGLLAGLTVLASAGRAQVVYLGETFINGHAPFLWNTSAPFDPADPDYLASTVDRPWVVSSQSYYRLSPDRDVASPPALFPPSVKLSVDSHVAFAGRNTSQAIVHVVGYRKTLYSVNLGPVPTMASHVDGYPVPVAMIRSMAAADRTHLTLIGDAWFFSVDVTSGALTRRFQIGSDLFGDHPNHPVYDPIADRLVYDTSDDLPVYDLGENAHYHAYGPNGLLYVLDYDHNRVLMMDPNLGDPDTVEQFRFVDEFSLQAGVTTANMQFAIGITGNLYFGDGLGGGSVYSAEGDYLSAFVLPVAPGDDGLGGMDYLTTDAAGNIYVNDDTGIHRYQDLSVAAVPEPSTYALLAGAAVFAFALLRRRP